MKPLRSNLKYILPKIRAASNILLFLDYDGTLTPIVDRPSQAVLSSRTRFTLKELLKNKRIIVSIVSGRNLGQIKKLVGLKNIYYAGNHGLEIGLGKRSYIIPEARKSLPAIRSLKKTLLRELKPIKSAELEDKGVVLAIHYRRVKRSRVRWLKELFFKSISAYLKSRKIRVARGKKVLEIRPPMEWDKGRYCLYLLNRFTPLDSKHLTGFTSKQEGLLPIYIGDDVTDEAAFKALRKKGITIFVKGEKKTSSAQYYLNSPAEVNDFLGTMVLKGFKK